MTATCCRKVCKESADLFPSQDPAEPGTRAGPTQAPGSSLTQKAYSFGSSKPRQDRTKAIDKTCPLPGRPHRDAALPPHAPLPHLSSELQARRASASLQAS